MIVPDGISGFRYNLQTWMYHQLGLLEGQTTEVFCTHSNYIEDLVSRVDRIQLSAESIVKILPLVTKDQQSLSEWSSSEIEQNEVPESRHPFWRRPR